MNWHTMQLHEARSRLISKFQSRPSENTLLTSTDMGSHSFSSTQWPNAS
jgi:hypothetical protein